MENPVQQDKFSFDDKESHGSGKIRPEIRVNLFRKNITPGQDNGIFLPGQLAGFLGMEWEK
jgi:hypothetical protein